MTSTSRHLHELIDRPVEEVYDYVADPANLPEWAPGLVASATLERVDGGWVLQSTEGRTELEFAERNTYGVLDHWVTLPSGERFYNPMRVVANGDGSEVVFTVRRQAGMTDAEFDHDSGLVTADLTSIKRVLEQRPR